MEPNQNDKSGQPIVPEVKKEETKTNTPIVNPAKQEEKVQPAEPTATDAKKISDIPDTKEPKEEVVKGKAEASEEKSVG